MTAIDPTPELSDDTPISRVRFSTRISNILRNAGVRTVGEIREASDAELLSYQGAGIGTLTYLRSALGLPSLGGVRSNTAGKANGQG